MLRHVPDVLVQTGHRYGHAASQPGKMLQPPSANMPKPGNAISARRSEAGLSLYLKCRNNTHASLWLTIRQECMKIKQITGYYKKHISLISF